MVVFCLSSTQEVITGTRNYGDLNNFLRGMGRGDAIFQPVLCPQADVNKGDWVGLQDLGKGFKSPFVGESNQGEIRTVVDPLY